MQELDENQEWVELDHNTSTHNILGPPTENSAEDTLAEQPRESEAYEIEPFPSKHAGLPIQAASAHQSNFDNYQQQLEGNNQFAPFLSKLDWEIARWAKIHGASATALTKLLQIEGVSVSNNGTVNKH
jgi:hypothetical protein